ncbi:DNA repair protein RadA [Sesamum angolense]|uniref:DNA repair protein RadA n=1 Tax=Sesamum angolense TaxID=2727404 RepID=A0AAE1WKJ7_9LAMI|nr:DNA repair protein RadA [Sesamum angolense]
MNRPLPAGRSSRIRRRLSTRPLNKMLPFKLFTTHPLAVSSPIENTTAGKNPALVLKKAENPPNVEVGTRVYGDIIGSSSVSSSIRKKGKSRIVYVCESCGYSDGQWWGTCKQCEETGTMKQFTTESANRKVSGIQVSENVVRSWLPKVAGGPTPIKLTDVYGQIDESNWRIPLPGLFGAEVERVLGGGLVPGSLVLVGGDPGVGKSTLLLQIAALIAEGNAADVPARAIYVSGEEMLHMLPDIVPYAEEAFFSSSVCNSCFILVLVEQIGNRADRLCIKTEELFLYSSTNIEDILEQAKRLSPRAVVIDSIQTVYLEGVTGSAGGDVQIGHVTKTGDIAGPRVLEHIVDVVLYMEGEKYSSHRLLRSVKNRFGSTDELGVFKMSQSGLQGVPNPSEMFLSEQHSDSDYLAGLAVAVIMDGSRAFLIEVQVIISKLVSSCKRIFLEFPIPNGIAFVAEVGLGGELRLVPQLEKGSAPWQSWDIRNVLSQVG